MAIKDPPALGRGRAGHFVPVRLARSRVQIAKRKKNSLRKQGEPRKTLHGRLQMNKFNAGNPKSVWYYTTGVNVHIT